MTKYRRNRCVALKANGERCKTFALKGEPYCVWHSQSDRGVRARAKKPVLSNAELAQILTKELNRVRKMKTKRPLQKAQEIRKLIQLILELAPEKKKEVVAEKGKQIDSFQQKVQKAKLRKEKAK